MYIKNLMVTLNKEYKQVVTELQKLSPTFEVRGGVNSPVDEGLYKTYLLQNDFMVDDNDNIIKFISTNGARPVINYDVDRSVNLNYNDRTLAEFNAINCEEVDPLKIRAVIDSMNYSAEKALNETKKLKQKKTILKDVMLRDKVYLKTLFQNYSYVIVPINLGYRIRELFTLMFSKTFVIDGFNNKVIAFNNEEALTAFIVNA